MCQSLPGLVRTATSTMLVPSMVKIAGAPLSFCERISELPSTLKSAASAICQAGSRIGQGCSTAEVDAVHDPGRRRPVVLLPQDVGLAVPVEISSRFDMPRMSRIKQGRSTAGVGAVHGPHRHQAGRNGPLHYRPGERRSLQSAVQVLLETGPRMIAAHYCLPTKWR